MGASVTIYNRYDKLIRQALTDANGRFAFDALTPDIYSVKVILASFAPVLQRNIAVAAGSDSVLRINLSGIFSTVELVPASASKGALMADDWKWVLRTSQADAPGAASCAADQFVPNPHHHLQRDHGHDSSLRR